jgi:hypothetical protein
MSSCCELLGFVVNFEGPEGCRVGHVASGSCFVHPNFVHVAGGCRFETSKSSPCVGQAVPSALFHLSRGRATQNWAWLILIRWNDGSIDRVREETAVVVETTTLRELTQCVFVLKVGLCQPSFVTSIGRKQQAVGCPMIHALWGGETEFALMV